MPIDIWSVLLGALVTAALGYVLYVKQRGDAERDWHRNNQKEIDWRAQDFVIEVQAFASNPRVETIRHFPDPFGRKATTTSSHYVFNRPRAVELIAKAHAFEARVQDSELKGHIQALNTALETANHFGVFQDDRVATINIHSQEFHKRMAELYGGPLSKAEHKQPMELEPRASSEPVRLSQPSADTRATSP